MNAVKLGVVCLLRNEADIAPVFLRHLAALFDHAVLMDHGSTDGTAALLRAAAAGRPDWAVWHVAVPGYHQDAFTGFAARHLFGVSGVDHVAFLDADEFLDVPDRTALEAGLAPLAANPRVVAHVPWRNAVPVDLGGLALRPRAEVWVAADQSPHCKTILPRRLFESSGGRAAPGFGNHAVEPGDGGRVDYHRFGQILHVPIRSMMQLKQKVVCGTLALLSRGADEAVANHWSALLRRMAAGGLDEAGLRGLALAYGDPAAMAANLRIERPRLAGLARRRLSEVAQAHVAVRPPALSDPLDVVAGALLAWRAPVGAPLVLRLNGDVLEAG